MNICRRLFQGALRYPRHQLTISNVKKFPHRWSSNTPSISARPEPTIGYDLALDRAAKIMINVTERAMTLVLHTHCGSRFVDYLGTNSHFDIVGCSDVSVDVEVSKTFKQYSKCDLVSFTQALPYRPNSFQFVVSLLPPPIDPEVTSTVATASTTILSPEEAIRVLSDNGYALLGAEQSVWDEQQMFHRLEALEKKGDSSLLSVQILPLVGGGKYYLALAKAV